MCYRTGKYSLQVCPCIFQHGNTCWDSDGVKYYHVLRPSHHMLLELSFNNLASLSHCTIKFHLSSCLKTFPSHASGTQFNNLASLSHCTIKFHLSSCLKTFPSHASGTQFNNLASLSHCTIKFHLSSSCLKTVPSHVSGTLF